MMNRWDPIQGFRRHGRINEYARENRGRQRKKLLSIETWPILNFCFDAARNTDDHFESGGSKSVGGTDIDPFAGPRQIFEAGHMETPERFIVTAMTVYQGRQHLRHNQQHDEDRPANLVKTVDEPQGSVLYRDNCFNYILSFSYLFNSL